MPWSAPHWPQLHKFMDVHYISTSQLSITIPVDLYIHCIPLSTECLSSAYTCYRYKIPGQIQAMECTALVQQVEQGKVDSSGHVSAVGLHYVPVCSSTSCSLLVLEIHLVYISIYVSVINFKVKHSSCGYWQLHCCSNYTVHRVLVLWVHFAACNEIPSWADSSYLRWTIPRLLFT
jgi:hypothetical protein